MCICLGWSCYFIGSNNVFCLLCAKLISESMLGYGQLDTNRQLLVQYENEITIDTQKIYFKGFSACWQPFYLGLIVLMCILSCFSPTNPDWLCCKAALLNVIGNNLSCMSITRLTSKWMAALHRFEYKLHVSKSLWGFWEKSTVKHHVKYYRMLFRLMTWLLSIYSCI